MNEIELKGLVNDLVESVSKLFKLNINKKETGETISKFYDMGHDEIEVQFGLNLTPNSKELAFLKDYTFENIKNFNSEMKDKLRKELSQGLLNNESQAQMSKRVSKVIEISRERAKMIVRTETNRAFNVGRNEAAKKSGLKLKKEWVAAIDDRTSPVCKALNGKQLPLDKKFKYQGQVFDSPPAHPNCRSRLIYVPY